MAIEDMKAWTQSFEEGVYERLARWGDTNPMRGAPFGLRGPVQISCVCASKLRTEGESTYEVENIGSVEAVDWVPALQRRGHALYCARFGALGITRRVGALSGDGLSLEVEADVASFRTLVAAFSAGARENVPALFCAAILHRAHQDLDDAVHPLRKQWPEEDSLRAIREVHSFFCERMKEWAIANLTGSDLLRFISEELGSGAILEITLGGGKKDSLH